MRVTGTPNLAAGLIVMHSPRFLVGFAERFAAELTTLESKPTVLEK
jgi:hypothetical protein